eukprot:5668214-Ditylum_brightwellii.AAC.1
MIFTPSEVLDQGLSYMTQKLPQTRAAREKMFQEHCGSSSIVITDMWCDLNNIQIPDARLKRRERSQK